MTRYPTTVNNTPASNEQTQELTSTAPASVALPCAKRRAEIACVPTEIALSEPPNIQSKISEGKSAACAVDDSGQGSREKKMMSTSFTALWVSMASTVGNANFKITVAGEPVVTRALPVLLGGRAINERRNPCPAPF